MDFNEDLTLNQLISEITDIFFPNGMSEAKDLRLPGRCLRCAPGILFWLPNSRDRREWGVFYSWKLFKKMKSTPVRIYLHTELKSFKRPTNGEASCGVITALESNEEDTGTPTVTFT